MQIEHPMSGTPIDGEFVPIFDLLRPTDVYPSTSGRWEVCPCPGVLLPDYDMAIGVPNPVLWVRPFSAPALAS